jgi:hypothetical protein
MIQSQTQQSAFYFIRPHRRQPSALYLLHQLVIQTARSTPDGRVFMALQPKKEVSPDQMLCLLS